MTHPLFRFREVNSSLNGTGDGFLACTVAEDSSNMLIDKIIVMMAMGAFISFFIVSFPFSNQQILHNPKGKNSTILPLNTLIL